MISSYDSFINHEKYLPSEVQPETYLYNQKLTCTTRNLLVVWRMVTEAPFPTQFTAIIFMVYRVFGCNPLRTVLSVYKRGPSPCTPYNKQNNYVLCTE